MTQQRRTRAGADAKTGLPLLRDLLQDALKVEHATIPPYLTAWLSIREGTNIEAAEIIRSVLLEEMLHLTLVANVLNAVGGRPRLTDPDFVLAYPQPLPYSSNTFRVSIEKFSPAAVDTFLRIERPEKRAAKPQLPPYDTLGQFYKAIERLLRDLCKDGDEQVFTGARERQVPPQQYYGSGRLIEVIDLASALRALEEIVDQGEGCHGGVYDHDPSIRGTGREPAHYYRFMEIRCGRLYRKGDRHRPTGEPLPVDYTAVYPIRANTRPDDYPAGSPVRAALETFADTYGELLASLEDAFNGNPGRVGQAVHTMFALKYQAQALMHMPSGRKRGETVGLTFSQTRPRPSREKPIVVETAGTPDDPFIDIDRLIAAHAQELQKPGALTIRPGYKAIGGRLTSQPAIVVTVRHKRPVGPAEAIPPVVGGYPTDVRQANAAKLQRVTEPAAFAAERGPNHRVVEHPHERDARTGQPLAPVPDHPAPKQKLPYTPPRGASLAPIKGPMTIVCHASPDAGFMQLKAFLSGIKRQLTVGLYEFGSRPVLDALLAGMRGRQKLSLVLDWPFGASPSDNQSDYETHAALVKALGKRLNFAWAVERNDPRVTGYVYPSAYHIKVAVKDHETVWLSSGNWNPSNQPAIDAFNQSMTSAERADMLRVAQHSDRDWHVIVTHAGLARTFEAYLQHDLKVASQVQSRAKAKPPARPSGSQASAGSHWTPSFKPLTVEGNILVHPLLTPDTGDGNYVRAMLDLIGSARRTLYIQTQYIELPAQAETSPGVTALVEAVKKKIAAGLDVRIIVSQWETGEHSEYLERLQHAGFDISKMRIQTGVHNKGFIVDSKVVAVGSQNWSSSGVLQNRDATLIIHDARAAKYFEEIFLHDWTTLATPAHAPAAAVAAT